MRSNLVRISLWLTVSLLGLATGWLIVGKGLIRGGQPVAITRTPAEFPSKETSTRFKAGSSAKTGGAEARATATVAAKTSGFRESIKIPEPALLEAGLSSEDRMKAEALIWETWTAMGTATAGPAAVDEAASSNPGTRVYLVPANQGAGDAIIAQLRRELREGFGDKAAEVLLRNLPFQSHFGAFGRLDLEIRISYPDYEGVRDPIVLLNCYDPADGKAVSSNAMN